jgi:hypothetical protein
MLVTGLALVTSTYIREDDVVHGHNARTQTRIGEMYMHLIG